MKETLLMGIMMVAIRMNKMKIINNMKIIQLKTQINMNKKIHLMNSIESYNLS